MKDASEIVAILRREQRNLATKVQREGSRTSPYTLERRDFLDALLEEIGQPEVGRFHVFGWYAWEANGGMNDHIDHFATFQEAKDAVDRWTSANDLVYDLYEINHVGTRGEPKYAASWRKDEGWKYEPGRN